MPSPNMPSVETAYVYPGGCLVEGTNLSEGRGTTRPFELFGAPFIHSETIVTVLKEFRLPGVVFRPVSFQPTFQKHAGKGCGGVFLHVTDPVRFRPFRTGCAFVAEAARASGCHTRSLPPSSRTVFVVRRAISGVPSELPESTTTISSAHARANWSATSRPGRSRGGRDTRPRPV